jgi:uncharacterized protein
MFRIDDGELILAASDLNDYLACPYLTQQRLAIARGERAKPRPVDDPHAELIRERGDEYEAGLREQLIARYGDLVDLSRARPPFTRAELEAATTETREAMRSGAPLIYQAQLFDGRWQGRTDFLRRVAAPSQLGGWSYEVLDAKLARHIKPQYVHQLSVYTRLLGLLQGSEPELAYALLGDGSEVLVTLGRDAALHRHVIAQLEHVVSEPTRATYPEPVAHCGICALGDECHARRVKDDHLSLVANIRRDQREQLVAVNLETVAMLGAAPLDTDARPMPPERFTLLRHQAELQVTSRTTRSPTHRHLQPERAAGYARVPQPSPGDVFFDLEGDPYVGEGGIEYLWGWWSQAAGYEHVWAHDADEEKAALEAFVERVLALRAVHPGMHVYHYAAHEVSKLRTLSVTYATREDAVDELLRTGALVDLYSVVRQALQVGEVSYSLKKLERHHAFVRRERRVREGGGSIVAYESWLRTGDAELLEAIRAYNEEDCRSTASLRDWLLGDMRPEAEQEFGVDFDELRDPEPEETPTPPAWMASVLDLVDRLMAGLDADGVSDTPAHAERRLLAHLLLYHHRENKPQWWHYFALRETPLEDLYDERDVLAGLAPDPSHPPVPVKRSLHYRFTFPPQEHRLGPGQAEDMTTGETHTVVHVGDDHVILTRHKDKPAPMPVTLAAVEPMRVDVLREALVELAESVLAGDGTHAAVRGLLRREPPRLRSGVLGESIDDLVSATLGLDHSALPVQGPPGTGKTFRGARMIVAALKKGLRVGVTAQSHAAIQNLLRDIEEHAHENGYQVNGVYKGYPYDSPHAMIEWVVDNKDVEAEHNLVAGTAWLFARSEHRGQFHLLFVDEAGQFSLANAAAAGLSADNLVLLGDPQQLPQVTQASHPAGAGASVLEHLLDGASTIPPGRGVLLTESWRMHPDVCAFVSERSYDAKLHSRDACQHRRVAASAGDITGAGVRVLRVAHEGRSQASPEEADAIADACQALLTQSTVRDDKRRTRPLTADDILVVAPYNLAVSMIRQRVPAGVRVGTVDRFQGQEAPVVFYAMTCSSGEDVPRGIDFLFNQNRLNVAISRAQCIAVLVHSPRLLDADCRTLEAMELVDGVCRFVELAQAPRPT